MKRAPGQTPQAHTTYLLDGLLLAQHVGLIARDDVAAHLHHLRSVVPEVEVCLVLAAVTLRARRQACACLACLCVGEVLDESAMCMPQTLCRGLVYAEHVWHMGSAGRALAYKTTKASTTHQPTFKESTWHAADAGCARAWCRRAGNTLAQSAIACSIAPVSCAQSSGSASSDSPKLTLHTGAFPYLWIPSAAWHCPEHQCRPMRT